MSSKHENWGFIAKVLFLCILWYTISSGNNVVGKIILNDFPYPITVTMCQLLAIASFSVPLLKFMQIKNSDISWQYYRSIVLPLAFGKFLSSVFNHVSIWKVPVSYAHTVKATMPLFTVVLTRLIFAQKQTLKIYLSLLPIIVGVGVATITELSFDIIGLGAALSSTCASSLQNIFSKKVLVDTGIHPLRLLFVLGRLALFMFFPVWFLYDGYGMFHDKELIVRRSSETTILLLALDGALAWLQNVVAFTIINEVAPLTYAVANASKRVVIILVSLFIMGNPITSSNLMGMMLAVIGVLAYNKAKYDANQAEKRAAILPTAITSAVGSTSSFHQLHPAYSYDYSRRSSSILFNRSNKGAPVANGNGHIPTYFVSNSGFDMIDSNSTSTRVTKSLRPPVTKIHKNSFCESSEHDATNS